MCALCSFFRPEKSSQRAFPAAFELILLVGFVLVKRPDPAQVFEAAFFVGTCPLDGHDENFLAFRILNYEVGCRIN